MQQAATKASPPAVPPASAHPSSSLEDTARLKPVFADDAAAEPGEAAPEPMQATDGQVAAAFLETTRMATPQASGPIENLPAADPAPVPAPRARMRTDKLVKIDRQALRAQGLLPPEHQERGLSDQYRQIKRPLIANAIGRGGVEKLPRGQLILVASAMPGEGKTFTSLNLALSLALEKDVSVLLIDADAPKPHLDRVLGVEDEPGLLELLRGEESLDPESFIIPTDVPGLAMLPIGRATESTTELLASHRMDQIMQQLADNDPMRIAVIDSPPLLLTSESRVLAEAAGQIVLVVRAGHTPQQSVLDAISHLGEGKSIGLVLNQSTDAAPAGYYYGYGDSKA
jgi:exopolysaccharide/PEP-CTERM locus tyrosine autokinase